MALSAELPLCDDWTELRLNERLLRIVARVSGRTFVGQELCRDEGYIDIALGFSTSMMQGAQAVSRLSPWLRSWRTSSLPQVRNIYRRVREAGEMLRPVIAARKESMGSRVERGRTDDILQWVLDEKRARPMPEEQLGQELGALQLDLAVAAIHTTTASLTNACVSPRAPGWCWRWHTA